VANRRPSGLRQTKVIKDASELRSRLAREIAENLHWTSRVPRMVADLKLDHEFGVQPGTFNDAIQRAFGKLQLQTRSDPDMPKLLVFLKRVSTKAYAGAGISYAGLTQRKSSLLDHATVAAMADEVERRRLAARNAGQERPTSARSIVQDREFRKRFPVIGGTQHAPGHITQDYARKRIDAELKRRGQGKN
jgi:hypothetical protein